jgi:UDP-N-acetylmuramate dehydrogenase
MNVEHAIQREVPLAPYCTLGLGGPARFFLQAESEDAVREGVAWAARAGVPLAVLGGGSNVVVADGGFDGLVLRVALRGIAEERDAGGAGGAVRVRVAAGEPWDDFVSHAVARGWAGVECLAGIPGTVGATPIQNVGAYGQEVAETIVAVRALDRATGAVRVFAPAECEFAYRDSAFKRAGTAAANSVVLDVTFALRPGGAPAVRYAELRRALGQRGNEAPTLAEVRALVLDLRRSKSMVLDPADENYRSAGSFFTNPIVPDAQADDVARRALARGAITTPAAMPRFAAAPGQTKLAAGWLIEHAGFRKGERRGAVGISSRHALALVHHGGGTSAELLALADAVRAGVLRAFGVALSLEPVLLGF